MKSKTFVKLCLPLVLLTFIFGCSTVKGWFSKKPKDKPPDIMADEGIKQLKQKKYDNAIETFEKVRDRYPYSEQALLAQIKVADAYFYKKKYDEALNAYKEFEKLHPTNKACPYVCYRQGLCYYRQRPTVDRDMTFTTKAMEEFRRLCQKYPKCEYVKQAQKYMVTCKQELAEHEFYVAEFYFRTKRYQAAIDRYQVLATEYPEFPKQNDVKKKIAECQKCLAEANKPKEGILSKVTDIFDAKW